MVKIRRSASNTTYPKTLRRKFTPSPAKPQAPNHRVATNPSSWSDAMGGDLVVAKYDLYVDGKKSKTVTDAYVLDSARFHNSDLAAAAGSFGIFVERKRVKLSGSSNLTTVISVFYFGGKLCVCPMDDAIELVKREEIKE